MFSSLFPHSIPVFVCIRISRTTTLPTYIPFLLHILFIPFIHTHTFIQWRRRLSVCVHMYMCVFVYLYMCVCIRENFTWTPNHPHTHTHTAETNISTSYYTKSSRVIWEMQIFPFQFLFSFTILHLFLYIFMKMCIIERYICHYFLADHIKFLTFLPFFVMFAFRTPPGVFLKMWNTISWIRK